MTFTSIIIKFGFIMNTDYVYVVAYCLSIHNAAENKLA